MRGDWPAGLSSRRQPTDHERPQDDREHRCRDRREEPIASSRERHGACHQPRDRRQDQHQHSRDDDRLTATVSYPVPYSEQRMREARPCREVSLFCRMRAERCRLGDETDEVSRQQDRRAREHARVQHLPHHRAYPTRRGRRERAIGAGRWRYQPIPFQSICAATVPSTTTNSTRRRSDRMFRSILDPCVAPNRTPIATGPAMSGSMSPRAK